MQKFTDEFRELEFAAFGVDGISIVAGPWSMGLVLLKQAKQ